MKPLGGYAYLVRSRQDPCSDRAEGEAALYEDRSFVRSCRVKQLAYIDPQGICQTLDMVERDVGLAPFDGTDVRPVNAGMVAEFFLRPASLLAQTPDVCGEAEAGGAGSHPATLRDVRSDFYTLYLAF